MCKTVYSLPSSSLSCNTLLKAVKKMHPLTTHILLFKLFSYHSPMEATILLDILKLNNKKTNNPIKMGQRP